MLLLNSCSFDMILVLSEFFISEIQTLAFFSFNGGSTFLLYFWLRLGVTSLAYSSILVAVSFCFRVLLSLFITLLSNCIDRTHDILFGYQFLLFVIVQVPENSKCSYLTRLQLFCFQTIPEFNKLNISSFGLPFSNILYVPSII